MGEKKSFLLKVLACVPFFLVWYFIVLLMSVAYHEGVLSVYKDAFGIVGACIGVALFVLCVTSIIYLRFFIKKEVIIQVVAYSLTIIFVVLSVIVANIGEDKFKDFSTEKWLNYPERRLTMYSDLAMEHTIVGLLEEEIVELLGDPDKIIENPQRCFVYDCGFGNGIYIDFDNGIAYSIYCIT